MVTTSGEVPGEIAGGAPPSIGRAIANAELFVMDRDGHPVPTGIPGELWIGGAGLARGYLNASGGFVAHPLRSGEIVYRSGDLVRYAPNGELEFLRRIDGQVKIHGFRIELGEVEAVLAGFAGVEQVCVLAMEEGEARLIAYVTGAHADLEQIRVHARNKLPAYMVPSDFVALESFPLTVNGKIDRTKLPAPPRERSPANRIAPRNQVEEMLAVIWREELRLDAVGVDENFFDIGGTSLTLIRIHARLEEQFPGRLSIVDFFHHPTIRALAAFLDERENGQSVVEKARERAVQRRERQR